MGNDYLFDRVNRLLNAYEIYLNWKLVRSYTVYQLQFRYKRYSYVVEIPVYDFSNDTLSYCIKLAVEQLYKNEAIECYNYVIRKAL